VSVVNPICIYIRIAKIGAFSFKEHNFLFLCNYNAAGVFFGSFLVGLLIIEAKDD